MKISEITKIYCCLTEEIRKVRKKQGANTTSRYWIYPIHLLQCDVTHTCARSMSASAEKDVTAEGSDDYRIIVVFVVGVTGGLLLIMVFIFLFKSCFKPRGQDGDKENQDGGDDDAEDQQDDNQKYM